MGINVLSLFDGMSCGQIALDRLGIEVDNYYASEVDKYAMQIAKKNYPNIIHVGDVTKVEAPASIDLLIGGSPCQGFSFAGKQLNFEDPRSKLFFEFVRLLKEAKPKYFLLENVNMKKEYRDVISKYLGVEPININSKLLSAQNRPRWYWTNIPGIGQPKDKNLVLKDVLEEKVESKYFLSEKLVNGFLNSQSVFKDRFAPNDGGKRAYCLTARYFKMGRTDPYYLSNQLEFVGGLEEGRRLEDGKFLSRNYREGYRVYDFIGKSACLTANSKGGKGGYSGLYKTLTNIRKLTPIECERLQTVPDNYTEGVSNTQRYKMLGNGWTVDVISHILKGMKL